ncbi:hypothetical protein V5O48_012797 [Marasmius crinis-equi]|uniref:Uncharacterized protein n=1 Tax=Marasmius crinis-equi TaxID=585013 RepID=A0ABR3F217_9AGAR
MHAPSQQLTSTNKATQWVSDQTLAVKFSTKSVKSSLSTPPLHEYYQQTNAITFLLDRRGTNQSYTGQFTIGEIASNSTGITNMPKLDVEEVHKLLDSDQHWQALTDKNNGIIGPDGQVIKVKSIVPRAPSGQLVAVMDSGFTFSRVPRKSPTPSTAVSNAPSTTPPRTVPCGQMLNISFTLVEITIRCTRWIP